MKIFILGVDDTEMREIEKVLQKQGKEYQYAMSGGRRVHPGNAYKADPIDIDGEAVLVECEPSGIRDFIRIDHHRPGDPGYGLPASEFWQASSLGQLWEMLGMHPSKWELSIHNAMILAAMDHCPAHAIRGECPGVSAQEVLDRKIQEVAKGTNHDVWEVREKVSLYSELIDQSPFLSVSMEGGMLIDLRSEYLGEGYSVELLAAQVAALAGGHAVLLRHRDAAGKPEKWSISGHASPEVVEGFMKFWAPAQGLTGIYGVPTRGYAGGYLVG